MLRRSTKSLSRLCFGATPQITPEIAVCGSLTQKALLSTALCSHSFTGSDLVRNSRNRSSDFHTLFAHSFRCFSVDGVSSSSDRESESASAAADTGRYVLPATEESDIASTTGGLFDADFITSATAAAEEASLSAAWGEAWILNKCFQFIIQWTHSSTGTPWWQSIGIATLASRVAVLPMVVQQQKNVVKMTRARPELQKLANWFEEQKARGLGKEAQLEYTERMSAVWKKYDCNPLKSMAPILAQAPIFIGFFGALRSMATAQVPSMTVGGIPYAWYHDLTIADPYYTLPILSSLIFLVSVELNAADGMQGQDAKTLRNMKNFLRILAVAMVPLTGSMPQSVFCYWITSNIFALGQSFVLRIASVRKSIGLPSLEEMKSLGVAAFGSTAGGAAVTRVGAPVKTYTNPIKRANPKKAANKQQ